MKNLVLYTCFSIFAIQLQAQQKWTIYNKSNSGLIDNKASAIAIDKEGNKWISSYQYPGVSKFDGSNWTLYNSSNTGQSSFDAGFFSLIIDKEGNTWLGSYDHLYKYHKGTWDLVICGHYPRINALA